MFPMGEYDCVRCGENQYGEHTHDGLCDQCLTIELTRLSVLLKRAERAEEALAELLNILAHHTGGSAELEGSILFAHEALAAAGGSEVPDG